jgi:hypothetical protein
MIRALPVPHSSRRATLLQRFVRLARLERVRLRQAAISEATRFESGILFVSPRHGGMGCAGRRHEQPCAAIDPHRLSTENEYVAWTQPPGETLSTVERRDRS